MGRRRIGRPTEACAGQEYGYPHHFSFHLFITERFILPFSGRGSLDTEKEIFALGWETAKGIPWGILILFGGGICLSEGIIASGLADLIAHSFMLLAAFPLVVIVLLVTLFITFLNEVISNTAMASIMVPLMAISSVSMGINPMMLMIP